MISPARRISITILLAGAGLAAQANVATWTDRSASSPPGYPVTNGVVPSGDMAYDAVRQRTVLFAGYFTPQTWEYDGATWHQVPGPHPATSGRLVYDTVRKQVVMLAGTRLYAWDGKSWTLVPSSNAPSQVSNPGVAFDARRGVLVRFGGDSGGKTVAELWEFDGSKWTQRGNGGPPDRQLCAMTFDETRGEVVLYGGHGIRASNDDYYADTWVWNGTYWLQHFAIPGPPRLTNAAFCYDPGRQVAILTSGATTQRGDPQYGCWEWDGRAWKAIARPAHDLRAARIAFDRYRGVAVLVGVDKAFEAWEYLDRSGPAASFTSYGTGCAGSAGVPLLSSRTVPRIGETFSVTVANIPTTPLVRVLGLVGASKTMWGPATLPLDMSFLGMTNCTLFTSIDLPMLPLTQTGSTADWNLPVPNSAPLAGSHAYLQVVVLEPNVNAFGAVLSNAGDCRLGF